jgi:hypothetical protein
VYSLSLVLFIESKCPVSLWTNAENDDKMLSQKQDRSNIVPTGNLLVNYWKPFYNSVGAFHLVNILTLLISPWRPPRKKPVNVLQ